MGKSYTVAVNVLSAVSGDLNSLHATVMFYLNLGLVLCTVIQMTALIVLYRKTSCASVIGLAAIILFGMSVVLFIAQLLTYVYKNKYAVYVIMFCLSLTYASFIMSCVYSIMLSKHSHKSLCIATGIMDIIPPIGVVFTVLLSYKLHRDTPVQKLVFNGYAYTYATLGQFCEFNKAEFIDDAGKEEFEPLDKKQLKTKLKELKRGAVNSFGQYTYASALAAYKPNKIKKAISYMKRAADGNYAPALFNLGYYHEIGAYVKRDLKKAKALYTRAAEAGDNDAALRLGIIEIKSGNPTAGVALFKERAEKEKDICAKYNLAVCHELGIGVQPDMDSALEIYNECIKYGLFAAQKRIFAIAATDINSAQNGEFFRKVTDREFKGSFAIMINGLIEIKKRLAADAADYFLKVVKCNDKWEGLARCIVGTLYLDCGNDVNDKCNGAEYIASAIDLLPWARDVFSVVPSSVLRVARHEQKAKYKEYFNIARHIMRM